MAGASDSLTNGRVRSTRLGYWHTVSSEDICISRLEFSVSLPPQLAHGSKWSSETLVSLLLEHVPRELDSFTDYMMSKDILSQKFTPYFRYAINHWQISLFTQGKCQSVSRTGSQLSVF